MPQLRQNIITGEWVVMAPERAKRPHDFIAESEHKKQSKDDCPFCVGSPSYEARYKEHDTPLTYMIPNKFPAFIAEGEHEVRSYAPPEGFYVAKPAVGGHDLVVVKEHDLSLPEFPQATMVELLRSLQKRYAAYRQYPEIEYVMAIYNHGETAGSSLSHPHAQLFASSIVPNQVTKELHGSERYYELTGQCVYCAMVEHELEEKVRVVAENEDFVAITFFAARFPFEIWILPKVHQSMYEEVTASQLENLAEILRTNLEQLNLTLKDPALNFYIHSLPTTSERSDYYHWHLEIAPRVTKYGGFEIGGGTIIDVVSPEQAAGFLLKKSAQ
jgi:UDPglucose--hexose-1-phosphate uridylyltransferase